MSRDAFSKYHPAVNFLYFMGAILFSMLTRHPLYLMSGLVFGALYLLLLTGRKGLQTVLGMVPLFVLISEINPLFNTRGNTVLFMFFGRPYTLEALLYGAVIAAAFVMIILWMRCYSIVLTGDKFTGLFGNIMPSISLLLVMVFRMVPNTARKAAQVASARRMIGKGVSDKDTLISKVKHGAVILGTLTSLSLEESVMTGDSMRARGYGAGRRCGFLLYCFTKKDAALTAVMTFLLTVSVFWSFLGMAEAEFLPGIRITPPVGMFWIGFSAYSAYLMVPTVLAIKEDIRWYILKSKI